MSTRTTGRPTLLLVGAGLAATLLLSSMEANVGLGSSL
jgi:hypothetical protein